MHERLRTAANEFRPHLVLFTGDVLNAGYLTAEVQDYLHGFDSEYGAYFVTGNVDGQLRLEEFCPAAGLRCLDDDAAIVRHGDRRIALLGLGLKHYRRSDLLDGLLARTHDADARLLLAHYPDALFIARERPVDFLFAGHTHGGQLSLPGFGPPVTLSQVDRAIAAGGLHRIGRLNVLVSRGIGMEGHIAPRIRFNCRPHAIFLTIGIPGEPLSLQAPESSRV